MLCQTAVPPHNVEHRVTSTSMRLNFFKCYWLPLLPPSPRQLKRQVSCHMPALPNAGLCRSTEQLGSASGCSIQFFGYHERLSNGDWLQSLHCRRNMTPRRLWDCVILLYETWWTWPWRLTYTNWPCHLNAAFWKQNKWKLGEIL
jgi:hypothetical protein